MLADLLGIDEKIRRENPEEERINVPSDPHHLELQGIVDHQKKSTVTPNPNPSV